MNKVVIQLITALLRMVDADTFKKIIDFAIETVEDKCRASTNKYDDALLPLCATLRSALNIPDADGDNVQ